MSTACGQAHLQQAEVADWLTRAIDTPKKNISYNRVMDSLPPNLAATAASAIVRQAEQMKKAEQAEKMRLKEAARRREAAMRAAEAAKRQAGTTGKK